MLITDFLEKAQKVQKKRQHISLKREAHSIARIPQNSSTKKQQISSIEILDTQC